MGRGGGIFILNSKCCKWIKGVLVDKEVALLPLLLLLIPRVSSTYQNLAIAAQAAIAHAYYTSTDRGMPIIAHLHLHLHNQTQSDPPPPTSISLSLDLYFHSIVLPFLPLAVADSLIATATELLLSQPNALAHVRCALASSGCGVLSFVLYFICHDFLLSFTPGVYLFSWRSI